MANVAAAVIIASGIATFYDPLVMDAVVENRIRWKHIDPSVEVVGYVALLDCDRLGELVWLQAPDGRVVGPVMVADCAAAHHRQARIDQGFAVDLSWELAQELGVLRAPVGGFVVWDGDPHQGAEGPVPPGRLEEKDRAVGPLSSACHPANGAGAQPLRCGRFAHCSGPAPF